MSTGESRCLRGKEDTIYRDTYYAAFYSAVKSVYLVTEEMRNLNLRTRFLQFNAKSEACEMKNENRLFKFSFLEPAGNGGKTHSPSDLTGG